MRALVAFALLLGACAAEPQDPLVRPSPTPTPAPAPPDIGLGVLPGFHAVGFTADERHFVFLTGAGPNQLRVADLATGEIVTLDSGVRINLQLFASSVLSPRSTGVMYRRDDPDRSDMRNAQSSDLYFATWDGQRTLIAEDTFDDYFRFAGDGRYILAAARGLQGDALHAVDLDEGTDRVLTSGIEVEPVHADSGDANLPLTAGDRAVVYTSGDVAYVQALDEAAPRAQLEHGLKLRVRLDGDRLVGQAATADGVVLVRRDLTTSVEVRSPAAAEILLRDDGQRAILVGATGADGLAPLTLYDVDSGTSVDAGTGRAPRFGPAGHAFARDGQPGRLVLLDPVTGQQQVVGAPRVTYATTQPELEGPRVLFSEQRLLPETLGELVLVDLVDGSTTLVEPSAGCGSGLFADRGRKIVWSRPIEDGTLAIPRETYAFDLATGTTTAFGRAAVEAGPDDDRALVTEWGDAPRVSLHRWSDGAQQAVTEGADLVLQLSRHHALAGGPVAEGASWSYRVLTLPE